LFSYQFFPIRHSVHILVYLNHQHPCENLKSPVLCFFYYDL
jgi:hypothetical protein